MSMIKTQVNYIFKICVAVSILSVSINMFLGPHHIAAGGVSGIGILLEATIGINRAWVVLGFNLFLLVLAAFFLTKKVFMNTLYGSVFFPISLWLIPEINLTSDRLLAVIFGSIVFALGVAFLYRIQASSGGTTIPPLIFKKYFGLNTAIGLFLTDTVIVCASLLVFGFDEFLFAILSLGITSMVMTYVETGLNRKKAVIIVSKLPVQQIKVKLKEEIENRYRIFGICEGEDGEKRKMIYVVVNDQQYPRLKEQVMQIDSEASLLVHNIAEVHNFNITYHPIQ